MGNLIFIVLVLFMLSECMEDSTKEQIKTTATAAVVELDATLDARAKARAEEEAEEEAEEDWYTTH